MNNRLLLSSVEVATENGYLERAFDLEKGCFKCSTRCRYTASVMVIVTNSIWCLIVDMFGWVRGDRFALSASSNLARVPSMTATTNMQHPSYLDWKSGSPSTRILIYHFTHNESNGLSQSTR
jgi:hypothetical protein